MRRRPPTGGDGTPRALLLGNTQLAHRAISSDATIAAASPSPSAMFSVVAQKAPLSATACDAASRLRGAIETA